MLACAPGGTAAHPLPSSSANKSRSWQLQPAAGNVNARSSSPLTQSSARTVHTKANTQAHLLTQPVAGAGGRGCKCRLPRAGELKNRAEQIQLWMQRAEAVEIAGQHDHGAVVTFCCYSSQECLSGWCFVAWQVQTGAILRPRIACLSD